MIEGSVRYDRGRGWHLFHDYRREFTPNVRLGSVTRSASVKAFAGPKLDLKFLGVRAVHGTAHGFLEFAKDPATRPVWRLYGGLQAGAGVKVEVLSRTLVDESWPDLLSREWRIAESESFGTGLLWDARAPMPTPRAWAPAVAYGDKIYVVGGVSCTSACHQLRNPSNALEAYDPATNTWERLPPMPTPRIGPAVAALNGKIYVMGGFNREQGREFELAVRRLVEIYDIAARSWTRGPDMLELRAWGRAVALGGKVYVLGGVGGPISRYHSGVEVLDPQTNTWRHRAPFAGGRYLHAAATANGRIYVIGGGKHEPDYTYSDIQEYDPTTDSWRARSPMPSPAGVIDAAVVGNRIWVFGGTGFCRVYDLATNLWEDRNSEHSSDGSFSVAHLNGLVYKFGGGGWGPTLDVVEATRLP